ncbi:SbcC/MukB-like Walker B domain-containing protein [Streptomyces sp. NPDC020883]|uniref:SbcC/MukB-like Walker B domain-containing protein n=1 Tax=Streptomyces sp. NPDC020883 TaxID=3365099 RepID=UPI0037969D48
MTPTDHPALHLSLSTAHDHTLGQPSAEGRWQPTRAGIVNSWAWSNEQLHFHDGWLALVGPNGSGKSLTAAMLVTVLLDADTSQTALSVSGKAAGTLTSRHTDFNDREDRTGIWWLEYGLSDPTNGRTHHVTTGLWLRAISGRLERAFFLARGRVGSDLILEHDRDPVRLDTLAEQLASCQGQVFTNTQTLRGSLTHLTAQDERAYRHAVRTLLFDPLNEVQFEALLAVLRSLRSVRTAEAISPNQMRQVLTDALPALDADNLTQIAEAMQRIAELETKLERTRREAQLLEGTDRSYRRYLRTVAQAEAAALTSANTEFDNQTRDLKKATEDLHRAQLTSRQAAEEHTAALREIAQINGRLSAAEKLLGEHAGAELPSEEARARDLAGQAASAVERAQAAAGDVEQAQALAADSRQDATAAQTQLTRIATDLRAGATDVGAQAAVENLLAASDALTAADSSAQPAVDTQWLCSHPLAWAEHHLQQIQTVDRALTKYQHTQETQHTAADEQRAAEETESRTRDVADEATGRRRHAEQELTTALYTWQQTAHQLGPLPTLLPGQDETSDRTDTTRLTAWLDAAADQARSRIDVPGHQQTAAADAARSHAAAHTLEQTRGQQTKAQAATAAASAAHDQAVQQAQAETHADAHARTHAQHTHQQAHTHAQLALEAAELALTEAETTSLQAARTWLGSLHTWRDHLNHLDADAITLPAPEAPAAELDALSHPELALATARAHAQAAQRLQHSAETARRAVDAAATTVETLTTDLQQAQQAAPVPTPPPWRTRSAHDGVPLWALVDFAPHLPAAEADLLEGALLVAGFLDALVTPDGQLGTGDGDLTFTPTTAAEGRTLADVLIVDDAPAIDAAHVHRILAAVPLNAPGHQPAPGRLTHGVLTAGAPTGYCAAFIGRTARERARQQEVSRLEHDLAAARHTLITAEQHLARCLKDLEAAAAERDSLPPDTPLQEARRHAARQRTRTQHVRHDTTAALADADRTLERTLTTLETAATARATRLNTAAAFLQQAHDAETQAAQAVQDAAAAAAEQQAIAQASAEACDRAQADQQAADTEQGTFPHAAIDTVQRVQQAEDIAHQDLNRARADVVKAAARYNKAGKQVSDALRELNSAATLASGGMLRTEPDHLERRRRAVNQLTGQLQAWAPAAQRVTDLLARADTDRARAAEHQCRFTHAQQEAARAQQHAEQAASSVQEMRALYGAEYQDLVTHRDETAHALEQAEGHAEQVRTRQQGADTQAAVAQSVLGRTAPLRADAEAKRDACLARFSRLIDERLATLPDDLPADTHGRPANLTAGLAWARRLLTDAPGGPDRLAELTRQRDRELITLENAARKASSGLAGFDRQVTLISIEDTPWRRAVVADPAAIRGEDVSITLKDLQATAAQIEDDLHADMKQVLKTSMFTRLQKDIQLRREAATELVEKIRTTLKEVRTGVAHVGVQVVWEPREDPEAQNMVSLITQPPSDETYERMYEVLRDRMNEKAGEPWAERVAHTFDYRRWYEWTISVTHASFEAAGKEKFREVTARSNPLEALSTGERRLATMLPLLAAAWSMYSTPDYTGPRLLSIDEIDAAFDDTNLRQILALLRSWDFDVLATAPFMTPLIKRETRRVMVHQVHTAGRRRVTVPWLWNGHGEPEPLTLDLTLTPPQDTQ